MPENILEQMRRIVSKRAGVLEKIVGPARAAANQMKDAGMSRGADPLMAALFEFDAVDQELKDIFNADPKAAIDAIIKGIGGDK